MQTAKKYAFLTADEAARIGVPPSMVETIEEVGLLYMEDDETGEHFTRLGSASALQILVEASQLGITEGMTAIGDWFPNIISGWPEEWSIPSVSEA